MYRLQKSTVLGTLQVAHRMGGLSWPLYEQEVSGGPGAKYIYESSVWFRGSNKAVNKTNGQTRIQF